MSRIVITICPPESKFLGEYLVLIVFDMRIDSFEMIHVSSVLYVLHLLPQINICPLYLSSIFILHFQDIIILFHYFFFAFEPPIMSFCVLM